MAFFKNLASVLAPNQPLAMAPQARAMLVKKLLEQSQTPQGVISPYGTAYKALQGLLMRRANIADRQENELSDARMQALAGQMSRATTPGMEGEDPRQSEARKEAARRAMVMTAGSMPNKDKPTSVRRAPTFSL